MNPGIPPFRRLLVRFFAVAAIVVLLGYGLFEARRIIAGPHISIVSPRDGTAVAGPIVHIIGSAQNAAFFSINGVQAFIDESGRFDKALTPPSGYTVFTVEAKDRFGRTATALIHITIIDYCPATG